MSNNVMWLVNSRINCRIPIAKYYPATGWYTIEGFVEKMGVSFDVDNKRDAIGPTEWKIEYDITEDEL